MLYVRLLWGLFFFLDWSVWFKCCYFCSVFFKIFFLKSIVVVSKRVFTAKKQPIYRILAGVYNLSLKNNCLSHHLHCRLT